MAIQQISVESHDDDLSAIAALIGTTGYLKKTGTNTWELVGTIVRTVISDPKDVTPANRPSGTIAEIVFYNSKMYFCINNVTPTWEIITST